MIRFEIKTVNFKMIEYVVSDFFIEVLSYMYLNVNFVSTKPI